MAKRILSALIPFSFFLITFSASAAIPVRWTVDTFRVKPLVYDCYHGETLDLAAAMTAYGEPLDLHGKTARLYWQTNGMEQTYWSTNATITTSQTSQTPQTSQTTNVLQATFVGSFDQGAPSVNGFIGVEGENYRASFTLNFRQSPGFTPAHISPPVKVLDFATTAVAHPEAAPFVMKGGAGGIDAATAGTIATNTVDAKVASWAMNGQPKPSGCADTNAVNDLIVSYDATNLTSRIAAKQDELPYLTNAIPATAIADAQWLTASATNGLRRMEDRKYNGNEWKATPDISPYRIEWYTDPIAEQYGWAIYDGFTKISEPLGDINSLSVEWPDYLWYGGYRVVATREFAQPANLLAAPTNVTGVISIDTNGIASAANVYTKQEADAAFAPKLTGRTYDFDGGSNFTKRVYVALTNVIQTLGGTVANPPFRSE